MNPTDQLRKRRLLISRILGIFISVAMIAMFLLFLFKYVDEWMFAVSIMLMSAMDFMINAGAVHIKQTSIWTSVNTWVSAVLFLGSAAMVVYGLISGNLILF